MRFLDFIAEEFLKVSKTQNCPRILVFPSRRAAEVFKQKVSEKITHPILFPDLLTTEQYVEKISGLQMESGPSLWLRFYTIYQATIDRPEKPELFFSWCPGLLSDFNELDLYLLKPDQFFSYLNEAKALEVWNLNRSPLPDFQQQYLHFWEQLPALYRHFRESCEASKSAYRGLCTRIAAERIKTQPASMVWFCGLNMLSPAEEVIIQTCLEQNSKIYWEADAWFYNDVLQEAGNSIRLFHGKWNKTNNSILFSGDGLMHPDLRIRSLGCPGNALQVYEAMELAGNASEPCAIVLGDDRFLEPAIHLAARLPEVNISGGVSILGFPFASMVLRFVDTLLHAPQERDVRHFINDPLFEDLLKPSIAASKRHRESDNPKPLPAALNRFFTQSENLQGHLFKAAQVSEWIESLESLLKPSDSTIIHCLTAIKSILEELETYLYHESILQPYSRSVFTFLLNSLAGTQTLTIPGKKGSRIEVLGMLETRCLGFDKMILLGCNEGILPAPAGGTSFIPYDVRKHFKLPGIAEKESVFSYHFYRLLSGCKEAHLLYNTQGNDFGGGEPSRYLLQLKHEWAPARISNNLVPGSILEHLIKQGGVMEPSPEIVFSKTEEAILKLRQKIFEDGLSPSAFNMLRSCHLKFYYRYVAGLKEVDVHSYSLDHAQLGSLVHAVFEEILPVGSRYSSLNFKELLQTLEPCIKRIAEKEFPGNDFNSGANYLLLHWAHAMIKQRLSEEEKWFREFPGMEITGIEKEISQPLDLPNTGKVRLKSKIDRIQVDRNTAYVLDYKTGKIDKNDTAYYETAEAWTDASDKSIQLAFYSMILGLEPDYKGKEIYPGFIALRSRNNSFMANEIPWNDKTDQAFKDYIEIEIQHILNPDKPICQTEDTTICQYCAYSDLCRL